LWYYHSYITIMTDIFRKIALKLHGGIWTLPSKVPVKGRVLLSYTTLPFVSPGSLGGHSNRWECRRIAQIWNKKGFEVDIVDISNASFIPKKKYSYCIDVENGLERLTPLVGEKCVKIYHITSAYWKFQNDAEAKRLADIHSRRGCDLSPRRKLPPSKNIELADIASMIGNDFTESTYAFAGKKIVRIPISTTHTFPSPEGKDFERIRRNYIWLGGAGMAHKGLDLVLEAFAAMPEYSLTIFGKKDSDFADCYKKELFETPNIRYAGMIDMGSEAFSSIIQDSLGLVFPSSSEGSSGGVVTSLHAGLIPIISRESGVDVPGFGTILQSNSIEEIQKEVRKLSSSSPEELLRRALTAWKFANEKHTKDRFSHAYEKFVDDLISGTLIPHVQ
jgi:glycosyltransferase involved in cell wall biosynthesis